jgi:hypothetical protein
MVKAGAFVFIFVPSATVTENRTRKGVSGVLSGRAIVISL